MPIVDHLTSVPGLAPAPGFAPAVSVTGTLAFEVAALPRPGFLVEMDAVVAVPGQ